MNLLILFFKSVTCFLFFSLSSIWMSSCGMRTAPAFIPEKDTKQTITDLKVQQIDTRVRLSWKINHSERIDRLQKFDAELKEGDYFIIHQKLIQLDCIDCEATEINDLKIMIPSPSLIQYENQVFYYLKFPGKGLKIHSYQISHYGPDDEKFSQSQSVRFRRSNVFPKLPLIELKIVKIEDQSQNLRFPFGKVVQHQKIEISGQFKDEDLKKKEKIENSKKIPLQITSQKEFRYFTLRISWPRLLNQKFTGFSGKGDYFERQELYRNHLYRTQNIDSWPETPINIKSASNNYYLDTLQMPISSLTPPLSADTHPEILPPRIPFYIDLSVKYVDTWHYNLRLVDRFGNESEASESVSFDLPKTTFFAKNFGKKILVPHTD